MARALVGLERGAEAWPLGREVLDVFIAHEDFESAADACDVLFQADQPQSLAALGQGIWLAVTYPIDPGPLRRTSHSHVVDETPDDADGAAVAATTALFIADLRAQGTQRDNLMFFASQILGQVARRHGAGWTVRRPLTTGWRSWSSSNPRQFPGATCATWSMSWSRMTGGSTASPCASACRSTEVRANMTMFLARRSQSNKTVEIPTDILDVLFTLEGKRLPVDHAYVP
jgi:hypothetical protein